MLDWTAETTQRRSAKRYAQREFHKALMLTRARAPQTKATCDAGGVRTKVVDAAPGLPNRQGTATWCLVRHTLLML